MVRRDPDNAKSAQRRYTDSSSPFRPSGWRTVLKWTTRNN